MSVFNSLEKFNGTGDLKTWLTRFRRCCRVTNKNEDDVKGQLVLLCLEGQALAVAEQLETERDGAQTFAQVVERLENVFDTAASVKSGTQNQERRITCFNNSSN